MLSLKNMRFLVPPGTAAADAAPIPPHDVRPARPHIRTSLLGWSAWLRLLAVLPAIALLWLAVAWTQLEVTPW